MRRKTEIKKFCQFCSKELLRKRYNGRLEDFGVFNRRRFCNLSCSESKKGVLTKHGYSWRARKHLLSNCEACGSEKNLHAHHIDQKIDNNEKENIQTLCKNCHNFWHSTQKRIGLRVAGKMPKLFLKSD